MSSSIEKVLFLPYYIYVCSLQNSDIRRLIEVVRSEPYQELVNATAAALGRNVEVRHHYLLCRRRILLRLCKYFLGEDLADTRRLAVALAMVTIDMAELQPAAVPVPLELKTAFEVWFKTGPLQWHYCFAENVEEDRFVLRLLNPYRMCSVHSPGQGYIRCREMMAPVGELPRETYGYGSVVVAPWMNLRREDLVWAIDVCQQFSEEA